MKFAPALKWLPVCTLIVSLAACEKKATVQQPEPALPPAPPKIVSAEPTSFDAIAKNLDAGGGFYFYLSTENFLKNASQNIAELVPVFMDAVKIDAPTKARIEAGWKSLASFTSNSGLNEISGFGCSSIALEPGYYQTKSMLHHYPGKGTGLIWQLSSATPNAVDFAAYLPEKTALASSGNLKLAPVWSALDREAAQNAELRQVLDTSARQFQQVTGLDLPALLASLGPNYSFVLTLDESRPTTLPSGPNQSISIPEPGFAFLIQVQDDVLINRIDQQLSALPIITKSDEPDLKFRILGTPMPFPFLKPTIAWKSGLLILASHEQLVRDLFEIKAGKKPGLAATPLFKKLIAGLPTNGRNFGFISPAFQKAVHEVQLASAQGEVATEPALKTLLGKLSKLSDQGAVCSVSEETPEGWIATTHGGTDAATQISTLCAVAPAALIAGIATPNFIRARDRAQATQLLNDLRFIDAAAQNWAIERSKPRGSQPTTDDLAPYLKTGTPLHQRLVSAPGATSVPTGIPGTPNIVLPPLDTQLTVPMEIVQKFQGTCPQGFWGPYQPK